MARIPSLRLAVAACTLTWIIVPVAAADEASRWDGDARSAIRLIAGTRAAGDAVIPAGIEIKLKPGWHTYWRYPGDAGIPPHFDFKGSQNVKSVEVRWPAPKRLPEGSVMTIGYDRDVILPVAVVPEDPAKPVTLRMKADYAICEKVCAPADGKAELALVPGPSKLQAQLTAAGRRVPKPQTVGQGTGLAIRSVSRDPVPHASAAQHKASKPRMVVDVAVPAGTEVDLFAEGPTPEWALPVPSRIAGAPQGQQRFVFDLDGAPPGAGYPGSRLTLTAVAGHDAIEVPFRLD
jgi:DsbC/DsbD-like thiol-disulfide interchange protein